MPLKVHGNYMVESLGIGRTLEHLIEGKDPDEDSSWTQDVELQAITYDETKKQFVHTDDAGAHHYVTKTGCYLDRHMYVQIGTKVHKV